MRSGLDANRVEQIRELGGEDLLAELVGLYLTHVPRRLEKLRQGIRSGDLVQAEGALHSFRSSSVSLGAGRVSELAGELEQLARGGRGELLEQRLPEFEEEVEVLLENLRIDFGRCGE